MKATIEISRFDKNTILMGLALILFGLIMIIAPIISLCFYQLPFVAIIVHIASLLAGLTLLVVGMFVLLFIFECMFPQHLQED